MKNKKKEFLYSICEEIMPSIPTRKSSTKPESFALMIKNGESLSPSHIAEISARNRLSPIFVALSTDVSLDLSRLYSRALGAKLVLPRSAASAKEILTSCNFSICESEESAIFSLSARIPVYLNVSSVGCRIFTARLLASGTSSSILIPYTKNRTKLISKLDPCEKDFTPTIAELRNILNLP